MGCVANPGWMSKRIMSLKASPTSLSSSSPPLPVRRSLTDSSPDTAIPHISLVSKRNDVPSAASSSIPDPESVPLNPLPDPVLEAAAAADPGTSDHEASGSTDTRSESGIDVMDSITLVPVDEDSEENSATPDADESRGRSAMKPALRYLSAPLSDGRVSLSHVPHRVMSLSPFDRLFPSRFFPDVLFSLIV